MAAALRAGCAYAAIVFAIGFALGAVRVLLVAPRLGAIAGVVLELPLMLTASWMVCGWLLRRFAVEAVVSARLVMGGSAFVLLMLAEVALSILGFGRSLSQHLAAYATWPAGLGLAAQLAFAAFPLRGTTAPRP